MAGGQNIARLGVVLGLDTAQFQSSVDEAIAANRKLAQNIKKETNAAASEILRLKDATEDYGISLTKTEQIQRDIAAGGKYANAISSVKDELIKQAKAWDETIDSAQKAAAIELTAKSVRAELERLSAATDNVGKELGQLDIVQQKLSSGKFGSVTAEQTEALIRQAQAYDNAIASAAKMAAIKDTQQAVTIELERMSVATNILGKELTKVEAIQQKLASGKLGDVTQEQTDALLRQAYAWDNAIETAKKTAALEAVERGVKSEVDRLTVAVDLLGQELTQVDIIQKKIAAGKFGDITAAQRDQLLGAARAADEHAKSLGKVSNAAGLSGFQMQNLVYQLNDVFVSLVSGQAPLTVLIQQGSQIAPIFGGITAAISGLVRMLGTAFITALTSPITAIVALVGAVVTLTAAFISGENENNKFINSLILSGNYANITKSQFDAMAKSMALGFNTTTGSAKELIGQLVASGKIAGNALEPAAQAIQKIANLSGESASKIASSLISAFDGSASSAKSLNDQYNFLTLEQYKHIEALDKQGKKAESTIYTLDLLNASLQRQEEALSPLGRLWLNVKQASSDVWEYSIYMGNTFAAMLISLAQTLKSTANSVSKFIDDTFGGVIRAITKAVVDAYNLVDKLLGGMLTKFGNSIKEIDDKVKVFQNKANDNNIKVTQTVSPSEKPKIAEHVSSKSSDIQINNTQKELDLLKAALEVRIDAIEKTGEALKLKQEEIGLLQYQKDILKSNLALEQMGRKNILDIETQIKKIENDKIARLEQASKQGKKAQEDIIAGFGKEIDFLEESKKVIKEKIAAQRELNQAIIEQNFKLELQQKAKETKAKS